MIFFLDEDRAYLNWVAHHRQGFVLDCTRNPNAKHLTVHRATCPAIKHSPSRHTHWTTGSRMKGCALKLGELQHWAEAQTGGQPDFCTECTPGESPQPEAVHLTRLDRDILGCVLEIAIYHLEAEDDGYHLTPGMLAQCLGKTEGQLASALQRLIDDGLLVASKRAHGNTAIGRGQRLFPTAKAMQTVDAYKPLNTAQLDEELRKLGQDERDAFHK